MEGLGRGNLHTTVVVYILDLHSKSLTHVGEQEEGGSLNADLWLNRWCMTNGRSGGWEEGWMKIYRHDIHRSGRGKKRAGRRSIDTQRGGRREHESVARSWMCEWEQGGDLNADLLLSEFEAMIVGARPIVGVGGGGLDTDLSTLSELEAMVQKDFAKILTTWHRRLHTQSVLAAKGGRGDGGGTKRGSADTQLHTGSPLQTVDARSKEAHTGVGVFVNVGGWWKSVQWRVESRGGGGGSLNADLSIPRRLPLSPLPHGWERRNAGNGSGVLALRCGLPTHGYMSKSDVDGGPLARKNG
ncbi:hypothetical protein BKA83DRAFT_4122527 [Pisolithus microcarpus]|nr:hypothetical protein BKA83DRAFT_4122527 [Pisolithus microcarpus]